MKRKSLFVLGGMLVLAALFWGMGTAVAQVLHNSAFGDAEPNAPAEPDQLLVAKVPTQMNYQGVLTDDSGNPMSGDHDMTFTIYAYRSVPFPGGWHAVYSETQTLAVANGLFNAVIGAVTPLDADDFGGIMTLFGGNLEMGVQVDGGAELSPRVKLLSVPYAFRSEYTNYLPIPYDSGWEDLGVRVDPIQLQFVHNLEGDVDDYVVDLQCQTAEGTAQCHEDEAYWHHLNGTQITVWASNDPNLTAVRVRIWRTQ
jgi:hypothetical protein